MLCYRPDQKPGGAQILWPGIRNDLANSGYIQSANSQRSATRVAKAKSVVPANKRQALAGKNQLRMSSNVPQASLLSMKVVSPDKSTRVDLIHLAPGIPGTNITFDAVSPGKYDVSLQWYETGSNAVLRSEHHVYLLDKDYRADAARLKHVLAEFDQLGHEFPTAANLAAYFRESTSADFQLARQRRNTGDFDVLRQRCEYALALVRYCRDQRFTGNVLLHQLANPWENFDATTFFQRVTAPANSITTFSGAAWMALIACSSSVRVKSIYFFSALAFSRFLACCSALALA